LQISFKQALGAAALIAIFGVVLLIYFKKRKL
jgi:hypothetical protein